jgi:hypothetical protein
VRPSSATSRAQSRLRPLESEDAVVRSRESSPYHRASLIGKVDVPHAPPAAAHHSSRSTELPDAPPTLFGTWRAIPPPPTLCRTRRRDPPRNVDLPRSTCRATPLQGRRPRRVQHGRGLASRHGHPARLPRERVAGDQALRAVPGAHDAASARVRAPRRPVFLACVREWARGMFFRSRSAALPSCPCARTNTRHIFFVCCCR